MPSDSDPNTLLEKANGIAEKFNVLITDYQIKLKERDTLIQLVNDCIEKGVITEELCTEMKIYGELISSWKKDTS